MSALGLNWPWLLTYLINIAIIFWVLQRFAVKPILGMLDKRENTIRTSIEHAHEIERRLAETQKECAAELEKARAEGQNIVAQASKAAERMRGEMVDQAKQEAAKMIERAQSQIRQETNQAILQLRSEVADLAIMAASRVVGQSLDQPQQRKLVTEFIQEQEAGKLN